MNPLPGPLMLESDIAPRASLLYLNVRKADFAVSVLAAQGSFSGAAPALFLEPVWK